MLRPVFHTVRSIVLLVFTSSLIVCGGCTTRKLVEQPNNLRRSGEQTLLDINTANKAQLESLPNVGPALADKIIEHRTRYGPFRRVEHLLLLEGISEKRFHELRPLIIAD